ncbi:MAG: PAS domain S-box protein [Planctomycetia bacterium]|nr:PAS domain S-box protein [Planctomycetia bacterium]
MGTRPGNAEQWSDQERWQILMDTVQDFAIFMLDETGKIITWNLGAERILGYKEEEILGHNFCQIFTPNDSASEQPEFELATAKEKGRAEDERWHVRKDGSRFWASGVVTPLWDDAGKLRGFAKVLRDITERKRTEERMAEQNQRKDEFLAMLAHELRNPLAAIANAVQLIKLEHGGNPPETVQIIERQVDGLERMVSDLSDASRMSAGKIQLRIGRVRLQDVVERAAETIAPKFEERRHAFSIAMSTAAIWLEADGSRLEQVFCNLLNNAVKYTEPGGKITLAVERQGNEAIVSIRDTGTGIMSEMLPRIFDLFIQADNSLERAQGGLGIGLTLVKRLVEMHGGKVEARSEGVGHGSEFIVRLPVVAETAVVLPPAPQAAVPEPRKGLQLLLAEDNVDTALTLGMLLRKLGHAVEIVHDGPAALRAVDVRKPDALLLDIGLPGLDGYQVAQRLRQHPENAATRLIAMTGYGQEEDLEMSRRSGFDHHLVKPVSLATLKELLAKLSQ